MMSYRVIKFKSEFAAFYCGSYIKIMFLVAAVDIVVVSEVQRIAVAFRGAQTIDVDYYGFFGGFNFNFASAYNRYLNNDSTVCTGSARIGS